MTPGRSEVAIRLDARGLEQGVGQVAREVRRLLIVSRATVAAERRVEAALATSGARRAAALGRLDRLFARRGR